MKYKIIVMYTMSGFSTVQKAIFITNKQNNILYFPEFIKKVLNKKGCIIINITIRQIEEK